MIVQFWHIDTDSVLQDRHESNQRHAGSSQCVRVAFPTMPFTVADLVLRRPLLLSEARSNTTWAMVQYRKRFPATRRCLITHGTATRPSLSTELCISQSYH